MSVCCICAVLHCYILIWILIFYRFENWRMLFRWFYYHQCVLCYPKLPFYYYCAQCDGVKWKSWTEWQRRSWRSPLNSKTIFSSHCTMYLRLGQCVSFQLKSSKHKEWYTTVNRPNLHIWWNGGSFLQMYYIDKNLRLGLFIFLSAETSPYQIKQLILEVFVYSSV